MNRRLHTHLGAALHPDRDAPRMLRDERRYLLALRRALHHGPTASPGASGLERLDRDIDQLESTHWARRLQSRWRRWLAALRHPNC